MLSRLDISDDGEEIAEEGAMWANAGESGLLFRVFGEPECGLYVGIRFDCSKATTDHFRAAIHTVIIA